MTVSPETLALIRRRLEDAERNVQIAKQLLEGGEAGSAGLAVPPPTVGADVPPGSRVIYGRFNGEHMEGEDSQLYPVPANYASKSKLVEGDRLKLTIETDGAFIYKQVGPIDRRRTLGTFGIDDRGNYVVVAEGKSYRIMLASVTFYRLESGDQVTILLPSTGEAVWGAVEHSMKPQRPTSAGLDAAVTPPPATETPRAS
jgi:hypothetical protein